jgi:hypothetical protein
MIVDEKAFNYYAYKDFTSVPADEIGTLENPRYMGLCRFKSMFKLSPAKCVALWDRLAENRPMPIHHPLHLMYALIYMYTRVSWTNLAAQCYKDEKTLRHWAWLAINFIANQDWVSTKCLSVLDFVYNRAVRIFQNSPPHYYFNFYFHRSSGRIALLLTTTQSAR